MNNKWTLIALIIVFAIIAAILALVAGDLDLDTREIGSDSADFANIAWIGVASVLVFIMAPGVALFYGGMLRKQSMTATITQTIMGMCVAGVAWIVVGYSIGFDSGNALVGGLHFTFLQNSTTFEITDGMTVPDLEFALFQMMFAVVTAVVVIGACAERIRYTAIMWFLLFWTVFVYAIIAHMVWGGGFFCDMPWGLESADFAGGSVVHVCAGCSGLALALYAGRRTEKTEKKAHSIPMMLIGAALLWVGWFGFNGGSGLAADGTMVNVITVTAISSVCAVVAWSIIEYIHIGHVEAVGACTAAIVGLVVITPGAGYVSPASSIFIGVVGAMICYAGIYFMRRRSGIDDALDVFGVHGIGGMWGLFATGIFAEYGADGLITGSWELFVGNILLIIVAAVFCFVVSYVIIWILGKCMKVTEDEEQQIAGQDTIEQDEPAYFD